MLKWFKHKNVLMIFAAAALLSAVACSGKREESNVNTDAESLPIEVAVAPVVERTMVRRIEAVGSLEAEDEVTLSSQAAGELVEIGVDIGSPVRKGQVVGRIDSRELRLQVEQAQAALRQAEARLGLGSGEKPDLQNQPDVRQARAALERARYDFLAYEQLVAHGDISKQQFDTARRAFEQAEARYQAAVENARNLLAVVEEKRAALALSRKNLADAEVVSPIAGAVKAKHASRGEYLQMGAPVVTIVQVNPLRLKLDVPEAFAPRIKSGQPVTVEVDSFPGREFQAVIKRINPSLDEKNRSLIAEAEVKNIGGLLRPGMFARAGVVSDSASTALMVPERAVISLAGVNKLFVVDGGRAIERPVKLGVRDGDMVEIVEGVRPGERVITTNTDKLQDGAIVSAP
jgi:RND family efflux transporter MFP subunit